MAYATNESARGRFEALLDDTRADLLSAWRQIRRDHGSAFVIVFSLTIGIAASTTLFSVIYSVLLHPYPYRDAERIVRFSAQTQAGQQTYVYLNGDGIRQLRQSPVIESVLAIDYRELTLVGGELPENAHTVFATANTFEDLAVPAAVGRGLLPSDAVDGRGAEPVAVLGYAFWRRVFGGDPSIVGRTVRLGDQSYDVVGVAGPQFSWYEADVYAPLDLTPRPNGNFLVNVRLKSGVTAAAADAALQPILDQVMRENPQQFREPLRMRLLALNRWTTENLGGTLYLLFAAVLLLLAIGCGNASILLLARGTRREQELAVRGALGAGAARLIRQLLTEALLLAGFGVTLGVALSYGLLIYVERWFPRFFFGPELTFQMHAGILFLNGAAALTSGIAFGLWPAIRMSRVRPDPTIHTHARRVLGSVRGRHTQRALVAGQIALTLVLLVGAVAAVDGFRALLRAPLGYEPRNVLAVTILLPENAYTTWEARAVYLRQLQDKVTETPGIVAATISDVTPPQNRPASFEILGQQRSQPQSAALSFVSDAYFETLRIRILRGHVWNAVQEMSGQHVAVINRAMAERYFADGQAIGASIRFPDLAAQPPAMVTAPNIAESWLQVVGVADDARNDGLRNAVLPAVYLPQTLGMRQYTQILARTQVEPELMVRSVRAQLTQVNATQQTMSEARTLEGVLARTSEWKRAYISSWVFGAFSILALVLAAIGLYSVMSYTVAQRANEFGVRMALGAPRHAILSLVFGTASASVLGGVTAGLGLTWMIRGIVPPWTGVDLSEPTSTFAIGAVLVVVVCGIACAVPAWRAASSDPLVSIRTE